MRNDLQKQRISVFLALFLLLAACTPAATPPAASPPAQPSVTMAPATPAAPTVAPATEAMPTTPASTAPASESKTYINAAFGLSFQYPADWFGPEEYIADPTLRVEVGSDRVYPYGTDPAERVYTLKNSYSIVLQYTRKNSNDYWKETYQALSGMADGAEQSDQRGRLIRERQLSLGRFRGFEYIATLSDTAQTEPVYMRQVILMDDQSNLLSVSGSPNNVELSGGDWRTTYRLIDEANRAIFDRVVESIILE